MLTLEAENYYNIHYNSKLLPTKKFILHTMLTVKFAIAILVPYAYMLISTAIPYAINIKYL